METETKYETYRENVATIARLAADAFRDHALTVKGVWENGTGGAPYWWRCGRADTGVYAFCVVLLPATVLVYGDLGEFVLRMAETDTLAWLRGATKSPDYLLSKVTAARSFRQFYPGDALADLDARIDEESLEQEPWELPKLKQLREDTLLAFEDGRYDQWGELAYDALGDPEIAGLYDKWDSGLLWLVELLRVFVRLHDAGKER